jgi:A/G-specific adenine glycosylase
LDDVENHRVNVLAALLEDWFGQHARSFPWRQWADAYRLTVVEILLQRTRADMVARFIGPFLSKYSDWDALGTAPLLELEEVLLPLGLQRRRASALHELALEAPGRPLSDWESLAGVGQYVSRAVRVAVAGEPLAMVDANFVRLIHRVFGEPWRSDYRFDVRLQRIGSALVNAGSNPAAINWAILDFGAAICMPRVPACDQCPVFRHCHYASLQTTNRIGERMVP